MSQQANSKRPVAILLIEDDPVLGPALLQRLRLEGFAPRLTMTGRQALEELTRWRPDVVLSDIRLPDMNGEEIWLQMLERMGPLPTFFMTAYGEIEQAVRLVKAGARDYLTKPVDVDALVKAIMEIRDGSLQPPAPPPPAVAVPPAPASSFGVSQAMRAIEVQLAKAARSSLPILLIGETGTGKEVAAQFVHRQSDRADRPLVAINCATIPGHLAESVIFGHEKGAFTGAATRHIGVAEEVGDGTLFLDEIGELPLELQPKLLRLIEARSFRPLGAKADVTFSGRIVSATHADLAERVTAKTFREDLYFRLNVLTFRLPPLRDRVADVLPLTEQFAAEAGTRLGRTILFDADVRTALLAHDWPGNIRELRNRIERAATLSDAAALGIADIFPEMVLDRRESAGEDGSLLDTGRAAIRARVQAALRQTNGNQTEAAKLLGVSRTTIWKHSR
jgi:DNA-binding NtrC family response regulator